MYVQTENLFAAVLDPRSRENPYPLYEQLRDTPVSRQADGTYVVSTYQEIRALLQDKRISSDLRKSSTWNCRQELSFQPSFIFLDSPDHTRLRKLVLRQFQTQAIEHLIPKITSIVDRLIDEAALQGGKLGQMDVVGGLANRLPVAVICEILGGPKEDEATFHKWANILIGALDPGQREMREEVERAQTAAKELRQYIYELVEQRRAKPSEDLVSDLIRAEEAKKLTEEELVSTVNLLLVAGHETTVNLITNGMLTLLRHPQALVQVRENPEAMPRVVEEVLRFDPPVHFRMRTTLAEVEAGGTTMPKGAFVVLLLASGSRDPHYFSRADTFDISREDNRHLGFGGGPHFCIGAQLARMEATIALGELSRRLRNPRLVSTPVRYRPNPALRGPEELVVEFEALTSGS